MGLHYNIYYIFQEEKLANPMDPDSVLRIQKFLEDFYKNLKPPWQGIPPMDVSNQNNQ